MVFNFVLWDCTTVFAGTSPTKGKMAAALSSLFVFSTGFQRISTLLLWLLLLARVDGRNQSGEVQTLLRFKDIMMSGDSSAFSTGAWSTWKETDKTPCAWYGVSCTKYATVDGLDLRGWYLAQLSSLEVLSSLTDLRHLDLSQNKFGGNGANISIPDDIGSLVGLTYLDLSSNNLSGPIPRNILACRNLEYLDLGYNALTGEIQGLSGLLNLQELHLPTNQLSGPFPKWLGGLDNLQSIDLSFNMFSGTIPSLPNLTNLFSLALDNNSFTGFEEPMFPGSQSLVRLSVSFNRLQGSIPAGITKLLSLQSLNMSCNRLSGHIPAGFSPMIEGVEIDLSQNQLTGNIPENLLQPTRNKLSYYGYYHMAVLNLSHNLLTGPIPFDGNKQYNYDILDFSHNSLNGSIPPICNNKSSSFGLLWLQNNKLSGDIVDFLAQCNGPIVDMRLANNSFSGDLSRIANISSSSDSGRKESNLQILDLSNNNFQMSTAEANPDPLRALLELFVLNTSVSEFRMQGNYFSGTRLPAYFPVAANSLQVLDLSNNHLEGQISGATFNSTWVPALKFLDLSQNDITGPVPQAIVMLPNLAVLNVSNNHLSGPLPAKLPIDLYYSSLFAGNGGLCGGPLRHCPQSTTVPWRVLFMVVGGCVIGVVGSFLVVIWRWRVYRKLHQQDADLLETLRARESAALMSLRDLRKATDNFSKSAQIGEGGFGTIYIGKLNDGTIVAIKRSKREGSPKEKEQFLNEVRILSQVNHRHLVKLLGCCMEKNVALLVFEFVSNGTLQEHLQGNIGGRHLSWKQRIHIAVQTADALNYLHSAASFPIYHRDVKSANILIDDELNPKVAGFGISKLAPHKATHVSTIAVQGTIGYIDPEYYTSYQFTDKSDVYSFGVVLLELISAKSAIDILRGGDATSLVNFATPYIESGDLLEFIDITLIETYNDLASHGRESILNVAKLAMKCLHMQSKARSSMHEVWKELKNIWLELDGTVEDLSTIDEDAHEDLQHGHLVVLSDSLSSNSSSFIVHNDATSIEMSQFLTL